MILETKLQFFANFLFFFFHFFFPSFHFFIFFFASDNVPGPQCSPLLGKRGGHGIGYSGCVTYNKTSKRGGGGIIQEFNFVMEVDLKFQSQIIGITLKEDWAGVRGLHIPCRLRPPPTVGYFRVSCGVNCFLLQYTPLKGTVKEK